MPIHNLTNAPKAFMKLGHIRKGDRGGKNNAPRDLDYFRVTFQPGKQAEALAAKFKEVYGDRPTEINVRFADDNIEEVWDANYECYKQGGLVAKAATNENGPYWVFYRSPDNSEVLVRDGSPVGSEGREFFDKPIDLEAPIYHTSSNEPVYLEPVGRLQVVIPELAHIAVGFFVFQPGSPRDIRNVSAELAAFDGIARSGGKSITGIPFKLVRREEEITKNIKGKLSKGPSWVVHLDAGGEWGRKAIEVIERLALPEVIDAEYEVVDEHPPVNRAAEMEDDPFGDFPEEPIEPEPLARPLLPRPASDPEKLIDPMSGEAVAMAAVKWNCDKSQAAKEIAKLNLGKSVPLGKFKELLG